VEAGPAVDTLMAISLISRGNAPAASTTISPGVRGLLAVCGADGGAAGGGKASGFAFALEPTRHGCVGRGHGLAPRSRSLVSLPDPHQGFVGRVAFVC
jgi:hypothetical protein